MNECESYLNFCRYTFKEYYIVSISSCSNTVFSVTRICSCGKFHVAGHTQLKFQIFCGLHNGIDNRWYNTVRAPRPTLKWVL
jgi:hypothetical protein